MVLANVTEADPERSYLPAYHFQIRRCGDEALLGGCTLRVGENAAVQYSGHIGYAVAPEHRDTGMRQKPFCFCCRLDFVAVCGES